MKLGKLAKVPKIPVQAYFALLRGYLIPQWAKVVGLTVLLFGGIALQLANPQIMRYFIDAAVSGASRHALMYAACLFIVFAVVQQGLSVVSAYLGEHIGWTATNAMRGKLAEHCLRLDLSFHKSRTPGEMIERIDGDVNALAHFFSSFVILLLSNLVLLVGVLALLYREDWRIGAALTVFVLLALFTIQRIRHVAVPYWLKVREMSTTFFGFLGEFLSGTEDTRANGATGYVMGRFHHILRNWLPVRVQAYLASVTIWMSTIFVFALGTVITFALSAYLWELGAVTIGTVYMIFHYTELLASPIEKIRTQMEDLQKADASIGRIQHLFSLESNIRDGVGTPLPSGALSVQFRDVHFQYEQDPVIQGIDFHLREGKVLGLLGRTGSGKSTLARLLMRFYDPVNGTIRVGDVDLRETDLADLRKKVGFVTQDVQLFEASVRDNLTFFDEEISDEQIMSVIDQLGLTNWLQSLPDGLQTMLAADEAGLSAGEAQLLAFTRIFLSDPGLIILDEASSRLDPASERMMEKAMDTLLEGRTAIIIAHRLATVQRADDILILDQGRILEYGDRYTLSQDEHSRFHQLLRSGLEEVLS